MKLNKKTVISLIPKAVLLILLLVIINTQLTESVVTGTFEKGLVFLSLHLEYSSHSGYLISLTCR